MNMPATRVPGTRVQIGVALAALRACSRSYSWWRAPGRSSLAGGSHDTVTPGARPNLTGTIFEWPVPTPKRARFDMRATTFKAYMGSHTGRRGVIE